jgi:parallel beta-helix repeat protein
MKKLLVVGVILLFLGSSIPVLAQSNVKNNLPSSGGNWLYVGGSGPGNYTKIQDAINASTNGDTIFVYPGSYNESGIEISKSLTLLGENKYSTVVNGYFSCHSSKTNISGFTIRGIYIKTNYARIEDNIISGDTATGVNIWCCSNNTIRKNIIQNLTDWGVIIVGWYRAENNVIEGNCISNNEGGIWLQENMCYNTKIIGNTIKKNKIGLRITGAGAYIKDNNFIQNTIQATFSTSYFNWLKWEGNYWGRPCFHPKIIFGLFGLFRIPYGSEVDVPWIKFDWRPAHKPYDIPTMN